MDKESTTQGLESLSSNNNPSLYSQSTNIVKDFLFRDDSITV